MKKWIHAVDFSIKVLTAVTTKSTNFWDVTPCDLIQVYRRFGGTNWLSSGSKSKTRKRPTRRKKSHNSTDVSEESNTSTFSVEGIGASSPMFQTNILSPSSGSKSKPSKPPNRSRHVPEVITLHKAELKKINSSYTRTDELAVIDHCLWIRLSGIYNLLWFKISTWIDSVIFLKLCGLSW
jgi:hypothetical protein